MKLSPIPPNDAPKPLAFYSPGVIAGDVVYLAGQIASDYRTGVPPEARRPAGATQGSDIREQVRYVLGNLGMVARAAGADISDAVRANVFLKDAGDREGFAEAWGDVFGKRTPPTTVSAVGGHGLLVPGTVVEIDLWAAPHGPGLEPVVDGVDVPPHVARRLGPLVHCGATTATDDHGHLLPDAEVAPEFPFYAEPVERQTRAVLGRIRSLLETWGGELADVVWARAFLTDLADVDLFDEVWQELMPHGPARSVLHSDTLPGEDVRVQVEFIAVAPDARDLVRRVDAPWVPGGAAGAMVVGDVVLLSSVTGSRRSDDVSPLRHDVTVQAESIVERLAEVLTAAGTDVDHLVRTQVFLQDLTLFHRYDRAWKRSLSILPPRTTTQTGAQGFLAPDALVSIDAVAVLP